MEIANAVEVIVAAMRILAGEGTSIEKLNAEVQKARPCSPRAVLELWDELGTTIVGRRYGATSPGRVVALARAQLLERLVGIGEHDAGGLLFALKSMLHHYHPEIAIVLALYAVESFVAGLVARENAYDAESGALYDALTATLVGGANPAIMVLAKPCEQLNRFLGEEDPRQRVKLIVAPRDEALGGGWVVYTVNYRRRRYHTYVPIAARHGLAADEVRFVHKKRFIAVAASRAAALALAEASLREYHRWGNVPARLLRWWTE